MTTTKKPRKRKINQHWADMELAGMSFFVAEAGEGLSVQISCKAPPCGRRSLNVNDCIDCFGSFTGCCTGCNQAWEKWGISVALYCTPHGVDDEKAELMNARKGSKRDSAMAESIRACPDVQAAIASAKEAATLVKHIQPATAKPTTSRAPVRL